MKKPGLLLSRRDALDAAPVNIGDYKVCKSANIHLGTPERDRDIERFAQAAGLPIVARVPRSEAFSRAEERRVPLMALKGFDGEKAVFMRGTFVNDDPDADTADHLLLEQGWVTIAPLNIFMTDMQEFERLTK